MGHTSIYYNFKDCVLECGVLLALRLSSIIAWKSEVTGQSYKRKKIMTLSAGMSTTKLHQLMIFQCREGNMTWIDEPLMSIYCFIMFSNQSIHRIRAASYSCHWFLSTRCRVQIHDKYICSLMSFSLHDEK